MSKSSYCSIAFVSCLAVPLYFFGVSFCYALSDSNEPEIKNNVRSHVRYSAYALCGIRSVQVAADCNGMTLILRTTESILPRTKQKLAEIFHCGLRQYRR
jgi:hypothetical protein